MSTRSIMDKQNNFNAQTWLDVRMFADICLFYQKEGLEIKTATILRDCVERVHAAIIGRLSDGELFSTATEAVMFLRSVGISTTQMDRDKRSLKKISETLSLEDRYLDQGGTITKLKAGINAKQELQKHGHSTDELNRAARLLGELLSTPEEGPKLSSTVADGSTESALQRASEAAARDADRKKADEDYLKSITKSE